MTIFSEPAGGKRQSTLQSGSCDRQADISKAIRRYGQNMTFSRYVRPRNCRQISQSTLSPPWEWTPQFSSPILCCPSKDSASNSNLLTESDLSLKGPLRIRRMLRISQDFPLKNTYHTSWMASG